MLWKRAEGKAARKPSKKAGCSGWLVTASRVEKVPEALFTTFVQLFCTSWEIPIEILISLQFFKKKLFFAFSQNKTKQNTHKALVLSVSALRTDFRERA